MFLRLRGPPGKVCWPAGRRNVELAGRHEGEINIAGIAWSKPEVPKRGSGVVRECGSVAFSPILLPRGFYSYVPPDAQAALTPLPLATLSIATAYSPRRAARLHRARW